MATPDTLNFAIISLDPTRSPRTQTSSIPAALNETIWLSSSVIIVTPDNLVTRKASDHVRLCGQPCTQFRCHHHGTRRNEIQINQGLCRFESTGLARGRELPSGIKASCLVIDFKICLHADLSTIQGFEMKTLAMIAQKAGRVKRPWLCRLQLLLRPEDKAFWS